MKKTLLTLTLASLLGASASAQVLVDFRDADNSTDQTYTFSILNADSGFGFDMEMLMTATLTDGNATDNTFAQWTDDTLSPSRGLGIQDGSNTWHQWIDTRSGQDDTTEGVTLTFREAVTLNPVEVDLGSGGLSLFVNGATSTGQGPTVNGVKDTSWTSDANNSYLVSATGLDSITAFANSADNRTVFALNTLDINDATVIPEPSTFALFAGALGLGLVMLRRRRS